jgi:hypothetical protein
MNVFNASDIPAEDRANEVWTNTGGDDTMCMPCLGTGIVAIDGTNRPCPWCISSAYDRADCLRTKAEFINEQSSPTERQQRMSEWAKNDCDQCGDIGLIIDTEDVVWPCPWCTPGMQRASDGTPIACMNPTKVSGGTGSAGGAQIVCSRRRPIGAECTDMEEPPHPPNHPPECMKCHRGPQRRDNGEFCLTCRGRFCMGCYPQSEHQPCPVIQPDPERADMQKEIEKIQEILPEG